MNRRLLVPFALAVFCLLGTGTARAGLEKTVDPAIVDGTAARNLAAAQERWRDAGTTRYQFRISAACFCPQRDPVTVRVDGGKPLVSDPDWFGPRSVPELFEYVDEAIRGRAAQLDVKYRDEDGVPVSIYVDRDKLAVDEEMSFKVSGFTDLDVDPLPPDPPPAAGGAANRAEAVAIARRRILNGPAGRSWRKGTSRSITCRAGAELFRCTARWKHRGERHVKRLRVRRTISG